MQKDLNNCSSKLYFLKYIYNHLCLSKTSNVGSPVLPKTQVCTSLAGLHLCVTGWVYYDIFWYILGLDWITPSSLWCQIIIIFSSYNVLVFSTSWSICLQCQMWCGELEFLCYHYGKSSLLITDRYCSHLLYTVWITFSLYLEIINVGWNHICRGLPSWCLLPIYLFTFFLSTFL